MSWIVDTHRLSSKQKGSMPRDGLQEHVFCLKTDVSDFLHNGGRLYVGFVDIRDAFGSIDHEFMVDELRRYGYPDDIVNITKFIYEGSSFQVRTSEGVTDPIVRHKGIIQGCPWSVIAFEQGIDQWLRWLNAGNIVRGPNPVQGYVDDVDFVATEQ